jgi:CheY-like chemotaxis protein
MNRIRSILLIDDNPDDNFFHSRVIMKHDFAEHVVSKTSAAEALDYLSSSESETPALIFLDINMPGMNGWEFLKEYKKLSMKLDRHVIVIMLSTSENPDDRLRSLALSCEFETKPITKQMLERLIRKYFYPE